MDKAVRAWAPEAAEQHAVVLRIGYFGSYARGDWGVGSDLDMIAIVEHAEEPFEKRSLNWDVDDLPVPVQLIVYSLKEWELLMHKGGRFACTLQRETVWVHEQSGSL